MDTSKIAVFVPSLHGGGAERAMILLCEGLLELGFNVDLLVASGAGTLRSLVPDQVNVITFNQHRTLRAILPLVKYLRQARPFALFSTIAHANLVAIVAGLVANTGSKIIVRESNSPMSEQKRSIGRRLVHALVPWLYPRATAVIAVSQGVASELSMMQNGRIKNIHVLPTPMFSDSMLSAAGEQSAHSWVNERAPYILACGRLVPAKGFDTLLKAFAAVRDEVGAEKKVDKDGISAARLIILGEGPLRNELEALTKQLGISEYVSMPGFVINPFPFFKHAALFVLSSRFEGMPNVLLQALAFGVPVVATDCKSGPRECLQDGSLGTLVAIDNVDQMKAAIVKSLSKTPNAAVMHQIRATYSTVAAATNYLGLAGIAPPLPHGKASSSAAFQTT